MFGHIKVMKKTKPLDVLINLIGTYVALYEFEN